VSAVFTQPPPASLRPENMLLNGEMQVASRGAGAFTSGTFFVNNSDAYLLDDWVNLGDGNNVVSVTQNTTLAGLPAGASAAYQMIVVTANKKFGLASFLDQRRSALFLTGSQKGSLTFKAKTITAKVINTMRAGLITWSSTADAVTSALAAAAAWGAAGANPTLATNWTYENTPANLALTTTWQTFSIPNVTFDTASGANVGVFLWCDDTDAAIGDELWVTDVNFVPGTVALPILRRPLSAARYLCRDFVRVLGGDSAFEQICSGYCTATTTAQLTLTYDPPMYAVPATITPTTVGNYRVLQQGGTGQACTALSSSSQSKSRATLSATVAANLLAGDGTILGFNNTTAERLVISCEL
jgi:hypothetical protein